MPHKGRRRRISTLTTMIMAAVLALSVTQAPAHAAPTPKPSTAKASNSTSTGAHPTTRNCATPAKASQMACQSMARQDVDVPKADVSPQDDPAGLGPAALQSAYSLPSSSAGGGQTVAIVDAFDNPNAEAELATYRQQYGLSPCTTANGCFKKIDQRGGTDYPPYDAGWSAEIALDIEMVSATCPNCKITLVESDDNYMDNLGAAVNQAVTQGAKFVSNSYGGSEGSDETTYSEQYFNHPGVAITVSSGDYGYGVSYPAASQYVTSVGGTSLVTDSGTTRGWAETAWSGAGSGCSAYEPKPAFQTDSGCSRRTVADVSAVADPNTGVAVYVAGGWHIYGGTSVSSPIIASVYALGGTPSAGSYPNAYPYAKTTALYDVTSGSNGSCGDYLCTAGAGYDGPTGLGTPNGIAAFYSGPHGIVAGTVTDAATGAAIVGAKITLGDVSTTTDTSGSYTLSVSPGTYDITVTKFGYATKTVQGVEIADGQSVQESFALAPKARVSVSGLVRDGSGHGWPVYAKVQVKGEPTSAVYSDPATGRYSLSVPVDDTYTVQVDSSYAGYQQVTKDVEVASADVGQDLAVPVDASTCSAAGYAFHYDGGTEAFDSATGATPPAGWTVTDAKGNGQTWRFDDQGNRTNRTGGSGVFAIADSDHYGGGNSQDTSLVSPVWDFTDRTSPYIIFNSDYFEYFNQTADVDLSLDGGATWQTRWHQTTTNRRGPTSEVVDLSPAAGQASVQVRFHFKGTFGWWWEVDNVFAGDRTCEPTPGGIVLGQVTDKNTGAGVAGAKVTSADKPSDTATTVATPDDANLGDGFYWFYSTVTGGHPLAASARGYTSKTSSANIGSDWATTQDFSLTAGQLSITPTTIDKTLPWQGSKTGTVTIKNTGSADATVKLSEQSGGFQQAAQQKGAPLQAIKGDYTPEFVPLSKRQTSVTQTPSPAAPPWTAIANYPTVIMDNAVATGGGKVYSVGGVLGAEFTAKGYVYDPEATSWSSIADASLAREKPVSAYVDGQLYLIGGWLDNGNTTTSMEVYDPGSNSWSAGPSIPKGYAGSGVAVLGGKIYVIGGCTSGCGVKDVQVFDPAAGTWSAAAAYPENTSWLGCGGVNGTLYCAGGIAGSSSTKHAYSYDPGTDTWSSIPDVPIDLWAGGSTAANGQLMLSGGVTNGTSTLTNQGYAYDPAAATWNALPNSNNTVYRGGSACGLYKIGGSIGGFSPVNSSEVLPGYDQCAATTDVTWLSTDKTEATLAPGATVKATVTLNANVPDITQPGTYTAKLGIATDTPYHYQPIGVTATVNPPSTWGKIGGTVSGVPCSGSSAPIKGATLQIDSWAASYTLKTDANGHYGLWLDVRNNPLSLIAAKDGWAPQARTVKIVKLASTTSDFALKPDHTCS